jgi:hypothetical protein
MTLGIVAFMTKVSSIHFPFARWQFNFQELPLFCISRKNADLASVFETANFFWEKLLPI